MDVTEAVETRIEVREYADEPVDRQTKRAVLEAGRLASSGRNLQHWRFILIDDPENIRQVADRSPTGGWVADAAFVVVVLTDPEWDFHEIDAGRAVTHMQLVAWEHGVGSCIYTVDNPTLEADLGVPDDRSLTLVCGFGRPARPVQGRKSRQPHGELAFQGRYGESLAVDE